MGQGGSPAEEEDGRNRKFCRRAGWEENKPCGRGGRRKRKTCRERDRGKRKLCCIGGWMVGRVSSTEAKDGMRRRLAGIDGRWLVGGEAARKER
jgi:hypothetical protein